jgi:Putative Actinobacterial Holin-X, holin superfamily III
MNAPDSISSLIDKSKDFLDTRIELAKLKTIDKSADVLSTVVVMVSMLFVGTLVIVLFSIGLALLLGNLLGAYHYGFFIVGGFYAIVLLVLYIQRDKWIKTPISRELINKMLK